jgi:hypothetical protein
MWKPSLSVATVFLSGSLAMALTQPTPPEIAQLAAAFARKVGLVDLAAGTTTPVEGTRYVCHAVAVQHAGLNPIPFCGDGAMGCWIAPAAESKPEATPTP